MAILKRKLEGFKMTRVYKVELYNNTYKVTIFKNKSGRFGIKHPSYLIHYKDFASLAYAKQFCKRQGWQFDVEKI